MISRILLRIGRGIDLDVIVDGRQLAQQRLGDLAVGRDDDLTGLGVDHVERDLLAEQDVGELLGELVGQLVGLLLVLVVDLLELLLELGRDRPFRRGCLARPWEETRTSWTMPVQPEGTRSEVSFTSAAFSPKMARSRRSSGASSVSHLRRDLADEDVAGLHLGTDADDAVVVEVARALPRRRSECRG